MSNSRMSGSQVLAWYRRGPKWIREIFFIAVVYVGYELSRGVTASTYSVAKHNALQILSWERDLHIDPERWLTTGLMTITPLAVPAAYFYSTMHYLITPIVLIWLYRVHPRQYRPARTSLAISTVIGLVGFKLVPTAPPRSIPSLHVPDLLFHLRHWGWWGGDGSVPQGLGGLTNQFAAMPSMHVGWSLWCGVLVYRYASRRWVRALGAAYPVATTLVVLSTGNHYLLDAVAGALVMALGALITWGVYSGGRALADRRRAALVAADEPVTAPESAGTRSRGDEATSLYGVLSRDPELARDAGLARDVRRSGDTPRERDAELRSDQRSG